MLRKNWLTWLVLTGILVTALTSASAAIEGGSPIWIAAILFTAIWGSLFFTAIRFGFLSFAFAGLYASMDDQFRVLDPSSWTFGYALAYVLLILVAPALYAFWISLGDKKLIRADLLDG